jgi:hypothetical protein
MRRSSTGAPLYFCYGHIGQRVQVPITGNRTKGVLNGSINIATGEVALLIAEKSKKEVHQGFLSMVRSR